MTQEELAAHVETQIVAFNEIMAREDTRSFSNVDLAGINGAVSMWRRDGVKVAVTALMWQVLPYSTDEKQELLQLASAAGWMPFYVGDNETE